LGQALDQYTVAKHVSRLLGGEPVQILKWGASFLEFRSYAESTQNIVTISGLARWRGRNRNWQLLVKSLRKPPKASPKGGWDREVAAYERLPQYLLSNNLLRAPKFLGADRPTRNTALLWLEYVNGKPAASWSLVEWKYMASALAAVQANFVEDRSLLSESWLNHNDLRKWVDFDRTQLFPIRLTSSLRRLVAPYLEPRALMSVIAIWRERNRLLDRLDRLPMTLCHNDIWSGNALLEQCRSSRVRQRPVIFDWQLVGPGPIGGDLAFAVVAGVWLLFFSGSRIIQLERALLSGYIAGLRKAGRIELLPHARESFTITAALRYAFMLPQLLRDIVEPNRMSEVIARSGAKPTRVLANRAKLIMEGVRWASVCGIS
jgi:hypothetical protein